MVRRGDLYEMDFPAYELTPVPVTPAMAEAMNGAVPNAAYMGRDLLCVFDDEDTVRRMTVDQEKVRALDGLLLHVTAPGSGENDCVSRSFAPKCGVAEDPVCGSGPTATSCPTGRTSWAGTHWWPIRPVHGAARCTAHGTAAASA